MPSPCHCSRKKSKIVFSFGFIISIVPVIKILLGLVIITCTLDFGSVMGKRAPYVLYKLLCASKTKHNIKTTITNEISCEEIEAKNLGKHGQFTLYTSFELTSAPLSVYSVYLSRNFFRAA